MVLPIRMTGLGLRAAAFILDQAYIASVVRSVLEDQKWWEQNYPNAYSNPHLLSQWQQSIDHVRSQLIEIDSKRLCPSTINFLTFIADIRKAKEREREEQLSHPEPRKSKQPNLLKLQHALTHAFHRSQLNELKTLAADRTTNPTADMDTIRLQHLQRHSNLSHLWLSVTASDDSLVLPDDVMRSSIRVRLGLEVYAGSGVIQCVCSKKDAFKQDPYHALTCIQTRSRGNIARHNLLLHRLAVWTRRVNIHTEVEPNHLSSENRLRPDLLLTLKSGMRIIDVAVVHPLTRARVSKEIDRDGDADRDRNGDGDLDYSMEENVVPVAHEPEVSEHMRQCHTTRMLTSTESVEYMKRRKYANMIREYGAEFSTAAIETTGGLGKEFRELLNDIAHEAMVNASGWDKA
ncbi:MAG: hypothetical protein ACRDF4_07275, partial [Rhabdochlamydiaceae bacterium]